MYKKVVFLVHMSHRDEILKSMKKYYGFVGSLEPKLEENSEIVRIQAYFTNRTSMNAFLYSCLFTYAPSFSVDTIENTNMTF